MLESYKDLIVWKKSIELVKEIYKNINYKNAEGLLTEIQKMLFALTNKIPKR